MIMKKVVQFETYYSDPSAHFAELLAFAGVDALGPEGCASAAALRAAAEVHVNSQHRAALQGQVTEAARTELREIFRPHNRLLDELLGRATGYPV